MGYIVGALLTWKKNILVCKKLIILISTTATTSLDVVAVVDINIISFLHTNMFFFQVSSAPTI
jgi:hypothetical protein